MGNFYFKTYKTNQAALPRFIRELSYLRQFEWGAKGEAFLLNVCMEVEHPIQKKLIL